MRKIILKFRNTCIFKNIYINKDLVFLDFNLNDYNFKKYISYFHCELVSDKTRIPFISMLLFKTQRQPNEHT